MQYILMPNLVIRIQMEPPLTPLVFGSSIPRHGQRLQSSIRKFD